VRLRLSIGPINGLSSWWPSDRSSSYSQPQRRCLELIMRNYITKHRAKRLLEPTTRTVYTWIGSNIHSFIHFIRSGSNKISCKIK